MLFPFIYIVFSVYVIFFRHKIERMAGQRIVLGVMVVVAWLVVAIFLDTKKTGWYPDRVMLLVSSIWFLFCGFLLALPMLNLQRWISQKLIFLLRDYLVIFSWVLLIVAFATIVVSFVM